MKTADSVVYLFSQNYTQCILKNFNNSDKTCQLRNAIKYDVLFVISYFNIPENIIQ